MLKQISSIVLVLLAGLVSSNVACSDERQPNIILVMADDVSWEAFGSYGGEDYKTPNLDRLASQGIRFSHCYSTPICTTSRVKIMTGKYNFRNYTHFGYLNPTEKTFGNLLQAAGYKTAIAGKWQLNGLYNSLPGHLDASRPIASGFDEYMLWQLTTQKGGKNSKGGERFWSPPIEHNGKFLTKEMNHGKYGPDLFCDFICDFMERNQSKPFFVYYPMVLVHDPFVPTPDTLGDQPLATANKAPKDKAKRKENFVAMVNYMDKIVGRIVDKVDEIGQSENTIILFTADNGTNVQISSRWNGQEIKGGKGGMKDNGTHVPLIAYWKGHTPSGLVSNDLIDFTDFYATFAQTAGVKLGQNDPRDGTSFLPQLMGKPGTPRDWVFCHYEPYWNKISGQFVRNQDFKLYRSGDFFQVPTDLSEANNLKGTTDKEIQKIMAQLSGVMAQSPPAPQGVRADKNTKERPLYPNWKMKN